MTNADVITSEKIVIFLVDDDSMYLRGLELQFRRNPVLDVYTFSSGEECIKNLVRKPDVVVLDYFLNPGKADALNGLNTLIKINALSPETHVIMLSAHINVELAVQCIKNKAFDFIIKNSNTFYKIKKSIKSIFNRYSEVKELLVWDW